MPESEKNKEAESPKETSKPVERPHPVVYDNCIELGYGSTSTEKLDAILPKLKK